MKLFALLFSTLIGFTANACPDLSGPFGGYCTQKKSCVGKAPSEQPVYYGIEIKQNTCEDVWVTRITQLGPMIVVQFPAETLVQVHEKAATFNMSSYDGDSIVLSEIIAQDIENPIMTTKETLKKGTDSSGKPQMSVSTLTVFGQCQVTVDCTIPEWVEPQEEDIDITFERI